MLQFDLQFYEELTVARVKTVKFISGAFFWPTGQLVFFGPPSSQVCSRSLSTFFTLAQSLGLPIKDEKTCLPSTCVVLHGIEVDSISLSLCLPEDKLKYY